MTQQELNVDDLFNLGDLTAILSKRYGALPKHILDNLESLDHFETIAPKFLHVAPCRSLQPRLRHLVLEVLNFATIAQVGFLTSLTFQGSCCLLLSGFLFNLLIYAVDGGHDVLIQGQYIAHLPNQVKHVDGLPDLLLLVLLRDQELVKHGELLLVDREDLVETEDLARVVRGFQELPQVGDLGD